MTILNIYKFFKNRKWFLFILVLSTGGLLSYFASKNKFTEDISKFIPKDEKSGSINFLLENLKIKDKLVLNFYLKDSTNEDRTDLYEVADLVTDTILERWKGVYVQDINIKVADDMMLTVYETFYNNLPIFLEEKDYKTISGFIEQDSIRSTLKAAYKSLLSPSSFALGRFIKKDPLNITPIALKKMQSLQFDENFQITDGYIMTKDKKNLLAFVTPLGEKDGKTVQNFISFLDSLSAKYTALYNGAVVFEYYGAPAVASGNASQMKSDSILTSSIALFCIALLLIIFFKRGLVIVYILLPVAFGGIFSLAACYLIKGEISTIALGAGAIILGIAINYSLHFFTHYRHESSIEKVIKDLTVPMLMGCATTVAAFFSLQFAKSQALHDFGLFAGCSLIGSVLFSLIVLPHLLKKRKRKEVLDDIKEDHGVLERFASYPFHKSKILVILTLALTIFFLFTGREVKFESDMMKINYQSEKLNTSQEHLDKINNFSLRSIYIVAKGDNLEEALRANERANEKLEALRSTGIVNKYASASKVLISDSLQEVRINRWKAFWKDKKDTVIHRILKESKELKFSETAFTEFYALLKKQFKVVKKGDLDSLKKIAVNEWVNEKKDITTIFSLVKTENENRQQVYDAFANEKNLIVFDKQYMASQFVDVISSDFYMILLITALLVFGFMLLAHGRIELAIINFLPMFLSWVWILGIMGILGIKFNIINIIISTFIFGLGDDYSIFIMDGLSNKYKYGGKNLESYKSSILLSVFTALIGFGVLIFAKHPALSGIAIITIIGMFTVLFISFIVQPLLYNYWILNRTKRGLIPFTLLNYLTTVWGMLVFFTGSLVLNLLAAIIRFLLPLPMKNKKILLHYLIQNFFKAIVYMFINIEKNIEGKNHVDFSKPFIIISNHQSHIDLALTLMLHPKLVVFTNDWVWNNIYYGWIVRMADYFPASRGYEVAVDKVKELVDEGYSVLIFPEGTRSDSGEILRFHKGAFFLQEKLGIDIQPILLHGANHCLQKGDFYFKDGHVTIKFLPRIKAHDYTFGNSYQERSKSVRKLMASEFTLLQSEKETVHYNRKKLIKNYIYKGPVLEWYCRIKTKLEGDYELFESLLPKKGSITDVGCGYGFLPLMLSFTGSERKIIGIDYDEEKISIAQNCVSKSERVNYICADVTKHEYENSDAFIISDVLHYLEEEEQKIVIRNVVSKLNSGGTLIIRDADKDKSKRHLGTQYTEFISTNVGFNKTSKTGLHFVSAGLIQDTLEEFPDLKYKILDNTKLTSNVIFVIKKD